MKTDDLSEKKISLGKCTIYATRTPGIYSINHVATVAAVGSSIILTGECKSNGHNRRLASLRKDLLETDVALIKEYAFGNTVAYKILDLSTVSLPGHMGGSGTSIWPKFNEK